MVPKCFCPLVVKVISEGLFYLVSLLIQCGDVETNPGPPNGTDSDVDVCSKGCKRSFVINCGFARVAILELSQVKFGMKRAAIDKTKRLKCFSTLFKHCSIQPSLNVVKPSKSITYFDDYCDYILNAFGKYKSDMSSKKGLFGYLCIE